MRLYGSGSGARAQGGGSRWRGPCTDRVRLVTGPDDPPSVLAGARPAVAREAGVREALDALLRTYLDADDH